MKLASQLDGVVDAKAAATKPLIKVCSAGTSYDTALSYQEALHTLQGAGLTNSDIGDILGTGIELQCDGLRTRLGYMRYLQEVGSCKEQEAIDLMILQPRVLQQRFGIVHEDTDYLVFNKPFDTKIDFGRAEPGATEALPKFSTGKHCVSQTSEVKVM